ncbi:GPP34 family phosphoprotein [Kitasatospora sp. NPDC085879]|uniref:GPP34 family phosphoprotein n=1 Tax=Kitasatospora sp. NPDC085879 TaxID=3154769 RepID=UPI00341BE218
MTTTARDLLHAALDVGAGRPPEQGDLSLALAGAELLDLLDAGAVRLEDDLVVPADRPTVTDPLLDQAASALVRQTPYESVDDWLWRRGRGLAAAYLAALGADGQLVEQRRHKAPFTTGRPVAADTPEHRAAVDRRTAREPVLTALAAAVSIAGTPTDAPPDAPPDITDDAVATVLAAVNDAVRELDAVRQRRAVEDAAFDNIWRGAI